MLAFYDAAHPLMGNSVLSSKVADGDSTRVISSAGSDDLSFGEFRFRGSLAIVVNGAAFIDHVPHILFSGAKPQVPKHRMCYSAKHVDSRPIISQARRVIAIGAVVQDHQCVRRGCPGGFSPGYPVNELTSEVSVSASTGAGPQPARICLVDVAPKRLKERFNIPRVHLCHVAGVPTRRCFTSAYGGIESEKFDSAHCAGANSRSARIDILNLHHISYGCGVTGQGVASTAALPFYHGKAV